MCGILALLKQTATQISPELVVEMTNTMAHRGPDDFGVTYFKVENERITPLPKNGSDRWNVGLGHRRLSIFDLSPAGHQPMVYDNNFWIVYNGEVYNFIELRTELEQLGHIFRSSSDTEVILAAYAEWGPECFKHFRGMWGLVIIDCLRNQVLICRDRMGIKPLYLWQTRDLIAVASEIKVFLKLPYFKAEMNREVVAEYLQTGYQKTTRSFFKGVEVVPPGTWQRISLDKLEISSPQSYWHPELVEVTIKDPKHAGRLFAEQLQESVRLHLRSDVPVGCALSGGLDSTSVVMLVNALKGDSGESLHTFTSTFPGDPIDEREYVDVVLEKITASPHFVTPDPKGFVQDLERLVWMHDEPIGNMSIYAAYCIARLTRLAGVPVTLNGQGGDEIFSGYWQTYFLYLRQLARRGQIFSMSSHFVGALVGKGNPDLIKQLPIMWRRYQARKKPLEQLQLRGEWAVNGPSNVLSQILELGPQARRTYEIREMYLPRLLKWEDRNSMAFSIEGRYPFLDHKLIELCLSFDQQALYKYGWTKWPLRLGFANLLPSKVAHRRSKVGFETPQEKWLCGPLRPQIEQWLEKERPIWTYIEPQRVSDLAERTWRLGGQRKEFGQALFRLFVFDRWLELFGMVG